MKDNVFFNGNWKISRDYCLFIKMKNEQRENDVIFLLFWLLGPDSSHEYYMNNILK